MRNNDFSLSDFLKYIMRLFIGSFRTNRKRYKFRDEMKTKTKVLMTFVFVGFGIILLRLCMIVVKDGMKYEKIVLEQQNYTSIVMPYRRGNIVDANGTILATDKKVYDLVLEPKNILWNDTYKEKTISAVKEYFGLTDEEIARCLENTESYKEVVRKDLEYDEVKPFMDYMNSEEGDGIIGVTFDDRYVRLYPNDSLACHLIGFTRKDGVGVGGLELEYDDYLSGTNGRKYLYINEDYNLTNLIENPIDGYNVITSIDANVQAIVEKKIKKYMEEEGAGNVSVLVMNPNDASVMALYNSHDYNLNDPRNIDNTRYQFGDVTDEEFEDIKENMSSEDKMDALNKLWRNFVVSDVFEPGSTYKTFTISGALEEGVVSPEDTFLCDGGEKKDIYYIKCHAYKYGGHGTVDLSGALENSCNDALMQIAELEGAEKFDKYQNMFGFGQKTNIDLPGEPSNASLSTLIYHASNLYVTELATSSFGQGVSVSMIELGTAFCSVINGGYYYQPSVVKRIEDSEGNVIKSNEKVLVRRTVSEEVSEYMKQALQMVVENGTGKRAAVEGYTTGGKTGTAEKLPRGNGKYLISYIGFAPVDDPQVVVYVVVDEPNVEDQGSSAASSFIFADICEELFPYLNIYKDDEAYDIDMSTILDEPTDSVYGGEAPENDVAGGGEVPDPEPIQDDVE